MKKALALFNKYSSEVCLVLIFAGSLLPFLPWQIFLPAQFPYCLFAANWTLCAVLFEWFKKRDFAKAFPGKTYRPTNLFSGLALGIIVLGFTAAWVLRNKHPYTPDTPVELFFTIYGASLFTMILLHMVGNFHNLRDGRKNTAQP